MANGKASNLTTADKRVGDSGSYALAGLESREGAGG